jgi:uncharacterized protein YciI
MTLFVAACLDAPGALERRVAAREAHLAYIRAQPAGFIKVAGPFLNDAGDPIGSMFVFDAESVAAVDAFLAGDPYTAADLFHSVEIRAWRVTIPWT